MPVSNQPYIGFEGPIGAGKTTLAQLLEVHLGATLILEDVDGNAFLPDFTPTSKGGRSVRNWRF